MYSSINKHSLVAQCFLVLVFAATVGCTSYRKFSVSPPQSASPPEEILTFRWQKELVTRDLLDFKPQEFASAAIDSASGVLFIGTSNQRFEARRLLDGALVWRTEISGAISSKPFYEPTLRLVFFGAEDGKLYALQAATGNIKWTYATSGTINHQPAYAEGILLFTNSEGRLYALDAQTGKWRWQYEREIPSGFTIQGYAGVTVLGSTVFTGFADGTLAALRAYSGDVLWTKSLAGDKKQFVDVDVTPQIVDDFLVTASYASGIYAVSIENGTIKWHFPLNSVTGVAVTPQRVFATAYREGLVALDMEGQQLWQQNIARGIPGTPVLWGHYLFLTNNETGLYVASPQDGHLLQNFTPGMGISASPVAQSGLLVVLTNNGRLMSFQIN